MSDTPTCQNLGDLLPPEHIRDAAEAVRLWMETNNYRGLWILGGVCSRGYAEKVQELERELDEQVLCNGKGAEREAGLLGKVERLERENNKLVSILAHSLAELPVGNIRTHTPESIPERIGHLVSENTELERENARLREALQELADWAPTNHTGPLDEAIGEARRVLSA